MLAQGTEELSPGGDWIPAEVPAVDGAWVSPSHPGAMITWVEIQRKGIVGFRGIPDDEIAAGISAMRQITLEQLGFRDWQMKSFDHTDTDSVEQVAMSGSYVRNGDVTVQFVERQYYTHSKFVQVSYLVESRTLSVNLKDIEARIERVALSRIHP